jgi:hypothetical protein
MEKEIELLKLKIELLEKEIEVLKMRPVSVPYPVPYPVYPYTPWNQPYITCGAYSTASTTTSPT